MSAVVNAGEAAASGGSMGCANGRAPLAARSAISALTASGDIDGGSCRTIVGAGDSAALPAGSAQSTKNNAPAIARASIGQDLTRGFQLSKPPAFCAMDVLDPFRYRRAEPGKPGQKTGDLAESPLHAARRFSPAPG